MKKTCVFPFLVIVGFLYSNAFKAELSSSDYHKYRGGLNNAALQFEREKKGRVAFLGGSITYNKGWRDSVCVFLQKKYPGTVFDFISAGIPSFGSTPDAFRLDRDVLSAGQIDLLLVEAAVNDRVNGFSNVAQIRAMEGIVRNARASNPKMDIIFMYFVDPDKIADYHKGLIPQEIINHEKVASYYNLPSVNLAKEVTDRIDNREFTWEGDFINLHPSPFGQQVYFRSIKTLLDNCLKQENASSGNFLNYSLPVKLDSFCYDKGKLIPVSIANTGIGWVFDKAWAPGDKVGTRKDFVDVPMLICTQPGKITRFRFQGTAIGIAVASGPDAGIIEDSIDNSEWKSLDLYTQWSANLHLPWFLTLNDELNPGLHTLKIRLENNKNPMSKGTACRIRYFYINKK